MRPPDPDKETEHAIETYKSLIQIGTFALKFVLLVNGGAAVALLAFLGNIVGHGNLAPNLRCSMAWFLVGIILGGSATVTAYLTQLRLYNEDIGNKPRGGHSKWLVVSVVLIILGLMAFAIGSLLAVWQLK